MWIMCMYAYIVCRYMTPMTRQQQEVYLRDICQMGQIFSAFNSLKYTANAIYKLVDKFITIFSLSDIKLLASRACKGRNFLVINLSYTT